MSERYERNIGAITQTEQDLLAKKRVLIAGCGGLGAYAAEALARIGLGYLTLIDGDVFVPSNLNRQLNSLESNLGKSKALEAKKRLGQVRTDLSVEAIQIFLNEENASDLLKGHDLIIDALDNVKSRLLIEKTASGLGIPLVHGAVEGWNLQVSVIFPGDLTLSMLYPEDYEPPRPSILPFAPAVCANIQAAEAVKVMLNKDCILRKKLLVIDMRDNSFEIIELMGGIIG